MGSEIERSAPHCDRCGEPVPWNSDHICTEPQKEGWHYVDRTGPFPIGLLLFMLGFMAIWALVVWWLAGRLL
jgi:hypothetical protein